MDEDEDQTLEVETEKYNFDYYALSKLKKESRRRVIVLCVIIFILFIGFVTFATLYMKSSCNKNEETSENAVKTAKIKAYKKISEYGENCYGAKDCGKDAYCGYLQGTNRCQCKRGYMGDGIEDCLDIDFAIEYKHPTKDDIPTLKSVKVPESDGISICSWFKLSEIPTDWKSLVMYSTSDLHGENDLMIWFKDNKITTSFRHDEYSTKTIPFDANHWTHFCWTWYKSGHWKLYLNGDPYYNGMSNKTKFNQPFPASTGTIHLGQDTDSGEINDASQAFPGVITELFIYGKRLLQRDVTNMYQHKPITDQLLVGWYQFKGLAKSAEIVEKTHPFF